MIRTTLRIQDNLKRAAEQRALDEATSLQDLFNRALEQYLKQAAHQQAQRIVFKTHDLGEPLDHLNRADYYPVL